MSRSDPFLLAGVLLLFALGYGALPWLAGGLYMDTHEGDAYHLFDILARMGRGEVPHQDFVTPLGALSFWPIHWLLQAGLPGGAAFYWAQLGVALCLLPFLLYAGVTRLTRGQALFLGLSTLCLVLSLSYGSAEAGVGVSMHYNRWAWSVAFAMLVLAFLPAKGGARPLVDGALIGLLGAALLLLKITYFAALVPIAAIALVQMHGLRGFAAACVAGLAVVLPVTLMLGVGYWMAYAGDLRLVAGTELRPDLGASLSQIAAAPQFIGGTLLAIAAAMMIRRVAPPVTGLAAFLMIPAFLYIASQNFGHAQLWLVLLTVLLLAMRPEAGAVDFLGTDLRPAMTCAAVAAFAVALPSVFNIAKSPLSNMAYDKSRFLLLMPEETGHSDVFARQDRAYMPTAQVYMDQRLDDWAPYGPVVERADVPELQGVSFPFCEFQAGSRAMLETLGAELVDAGVPEGSRLFTADLLAAYWFFAPVVPPEGSAPWYYGQLTGLENTDYVMVPKCPFATRARDIIIGELAASDMAFTLVRDNDLMALFRVGGDRDQPNISPATR